MSRTGLRHGLAISVSVLASAGVFTVFASGEPPSAFGSDGAPSPMLCLPAALIALLLVAFVLLPLWRLFAGAGAKARLRFALVAAGLWLVVCAIVAALTGVDARDPILGLPELLLPGWALIAAFAVLAEKSGFAARSKRSDGPQGLSAQADRAA